MAVTKYYTFNGMIMGESTNGVRTTYGRDALGSVVATFDSTGAMQNDYRYSPFGTTTTKNGTANDPKFLWNGSSGYRSSGSFYCAFYVRARSLDSNSGRWTTVDPLWPSRQSYVYSDQSPVTRLDASGQLSCKSQGKITPSQPQCGGAVWIVDWVLGPKEQNGFIVQEVNMNWDVTPCDPSKRAYSDHLRYWEAWYVINGKAYNCKLGFTGNLHLPVNEPNKPDGDHFETAQNLCSTGRTVTTGDAYFLKELPEAFWLCGLVPNARNLLSTWQRPKGWPPSEGQVEHALRVNYECCCPAPECTFPGPNSDERITPSGCGL